MGKKKDLPKKQFEKNLQAITPLNGIYTAYGYFIQELAKQAIIIN